jgi:hypothetical protein
MRWSMRGIAPAELEDAEGRKQSSGVLTTKLYPRNYVQVIGAGQHGPAEKGPVAALRRLRWRPGGDIEKPLRA